jgi:nucleotide-binding universal stress UspA family protein
MTTAENLPILAGVDGSAPSTEAAFWAADEAIRRGRPLRLVHAYSWPVEPSAVTAPAYGLSEASVREPAEEVLAEALAKVKAAVPGVPVAGRVVAGSAARTLVELSSGASMVVTGHRGRGGFLSLLLGSVAAHVAAHARCPVAVIRPAIAGTGGPVVVGVDGSAACDEVVRIAFEEADIRGVGLLALHSWTPPSPPWRSEARSPGRELPELTSARVDRLQEWVRPWREKYPHIPVDCRVTERRPAGALIDASCDASLVVVGSHGHGSFAGLLLGSVSQQVIHHAAGPVVVAHTRPS